MLRQNSKLYFVCMLVSLKITAQQLPQYTDYITNYFSYNPAYAGMQSCLNARAGIRSQWVGIRSEPQTAFFTINARFKKRKEWTYNKHGWGLKIENDGINHDRPFSMLSIQLAYSYHIAITQKLFLATGLYLGAMQYVVKENYIRFPETSYLNDPIVQKLTDAKLLFPDVNPGVLLYNDKGYIGYSLKNSLQNSLSGVFGTKSKSYFAFHHYITIAYRLKNRLGPFYLTPSVNIKIASYVPPSFELTTMFAYQNVFYVGTQYRFNDGFNFIINYKFQKFMLSYSYDMNLSKIRYGSANGHELIIGYKHCIAKVNEKAVVNCPVFD